MKVSLRRCESYETEVLLRALQSLLEPLGGIEAYIQPGMRVLVKPNMIGAAGPERAVVTHPTLVRVVVRMIKEAGGFPVLGDSPGFHTTEEALRRIYRACGYEAIAEEEKIPLLTKEGWDWVSVPNPYVLERIPMSKGMRDVDVVINLPKLKTHGLTGYSGAVKNLYGVMAGLSKAQHHAIFPKRNDFADMLLDIQRTVHPVLHIMDGILAMEGAGPTAGTPRWANFLAASPDPYALDAVCVELAGLPAHEMLTVQRSITRGLLGPHLQNIIILGDSLEACRCARPFLPAVKSRNIIVSQLRKWAVAVVPKPLRTALRDWPLFDYAACKGCGDCQRTCPPGAIAMGEDHRPKVDYSRCISCFCCQEMCRHKAISIGRRRVWPTRP